MFAGSKNRTVSFIFVLDVFKLSYVLSFYLFIFSIWVFFHEHLRLIGLQGKGEAISLTPGGYCSELTSAHSYQLDSDEETFFS